MKDIGAVIIVLFCIAVGWPEFVGGTVGKIVSAYGSQVTRFGETR